MHALPFELALIGGAAVGTVLIGNSLSVSREALGGFAKAFRGAKWGRDDYQDLLVLLGTLMRKARQGGFVAIESDIEDPETSAVFQAAPRILDDDAASGMVCDAFRLMALDLSDPARAEARMDQSIAVYLDQRMKAVGALHTLADALPGRDPVGAGGLCRGAAAGNCAGNGPHYHPACPPAGPVHAGAGSQRLALRCQVTNSGLKFAGNV